MAKRDDLATGLDSLAPSGNNSSMLKVDFMFGDRPEVLEAIKRARSDRKLGYGQIADFLTANGHKISDKAIKSWLLSQGVQ